MKVSQSTIRHIILILLPVFFFSCDVFNQWFCEEEPEKIGAVLDSISVGSDGGILKSDSIEIEIPAGAFTTTQNLKLIVAEDTDVTYLNQDSKLYYIEGITENPRTPLKFKMKEDNAPGDEQDAIFVFARETDSITSPVVAQYNDGWIEADVTFRDRFLDEEDKSSSLKSVSSYSRYVWFKTMKFSYKTDHFRIYFDLSDGKSNIEKIGQYLENAYSKFTELGFVCNINEGTVFVWEMDGNKYGMLNKNNITGKNIQVNNKFLDKKEEIKVTVSHELFHWIQYEYDYTFYGDLKNLWIDEAFAVWSEQLFSSTTPHYPSVIFGHEYEPFEGLQKGAYKLSGDIYGSRDLQTYHGYGCASFIKYLVRKYGMGYPIKVYQELKNDVHPIKALHKSTNNQMASYWQDYLEQAMLNQLFIHPSMPYHKNFEGTNSPWILGRLNINTSDTSVTYTNIYADLSAKVFRVDVDPSFSGYDPKMELKFKVDKTTNMEAISIFKISERNIELLGSTYDSIVIGSLDKLNLDHHYLYAMVSNSNFINSPAEYTNSMPISLTIETLGKPSGCQGVLSYDCIMRTISSTETRLDTLNSFIQAMPYIKSLTNLEFVLGIAEGELNGRKFTAEYDQIVHVNASNYNDHKGTIEVTFNEAKDVIEKYHWVATTQSHQSGYIVQYKTDFTCVNIPYYSKNKRNETIFGFVDQPVINYITKFTYHETYADGSTRELVKLLPSANNSVAVIFIGLDNL